MLLLLGRYLPPNKSNGTLCLLSELLRNVHLEPWEGTTQHPSLHSECVAAQASWTTQGQSHFHLHSLPSKSKQQPQAAPPMEPWAQCLVTWMLMMLHPLWTGNQTYGASPLCLGNSMSSLQSPLAERKPTIHASLAQERFLPLRGQRFHGYSRERRPGTQCWLSISSC